MSAPNNRTRPATTASCRPAQRDLSVEKIGFVAHDSAQQRLELEPAGAFGSDLRASERRGLVFDLYDFARGLGQELRLQERSIVTNHQSAASSTV